MPKPFIIRQIIAAFLCVLFIAGITPKKLWHDAVANHTDSRAGIQDKTKPVQFSKAGFHCQVDNLVAESPFQPSVFLVSTSAISFQIQHTVFACHPARIHLIDTSPRGPPTFA